MQDGTDRIASVHSTAASSRMVRIAAEAWPRVCEVMASGGLCD